MARTRTLLAPIAISLVLLAGCGASGGDDEASPTTESDTPTTEVETPATDVETPTTEAEDPDETTTTEDDTDEPSGDSAAICDALSSISEYDQQSSELINGGAEWSEIQSFLVDNTGEVVDAYDEAIGAAQDAAEDDLAENLTVLRDFTDGFADVAADATSLEDLSSKAMSIDGIMEAGTAGLELDTFAEAECGFSTGGN